MRKPALALIAALAGCAQQTADQATIAAVEAAQQNAVADAGAIQCARSGQSELRRECLIERTSSDSGLILTLRHPDGGFRRLLVTRDGRGVVAADGAEPAAVAVTGPGEIEVSVAGDRYRLPATVKGDGAAK